VASKGKKSWKSRIELNRCFLLQSPAVLVPTVHSTGHATNASHSFIKHYGSSSNRIAMPMQSVAMQDRPEQALVHA
jgi:hypothetical protein